MQNAIDFYNPEENIFINKSIRFNPELSFGEKIFLAEVYALSQKNEKKTCPFSSRILSDLFGVSHQTILNWIRKLVEMDLIEVGIDYTNTECRQFLKTKNL